MQTIVVESARNISPRLRLPAGCCGLNQLLLHKKPGDCQHKVAFLYTLCFKMYYSVIYSVESQKRATWPLPHGHSLSHFRKTPLPHGSIPLVLKLTTGGADDARDGGAIAVRRERSA